MASIWSIHETLEEIRDFLVGGGPLEIKIVDGGFS